MVHSLKFVYYFFAWKEISKHKSNLIEKHKEFWREKKNKQKKKKHFLVIFIFSVRVFVKLPWRHQCN